MDRYGDRGVVAALGFVEPLGRVQISSVSQLKTKNRHSGDLLLLNQYYFFSCKSTLVIISFSFLRTFKVISLSTSNIWRM